MARVSKSSLRAQIFLYGGVVADIAAHYNKTRQTIYNWLKEYDLESELLDARDSIHDYAERNIFHAVKAGDLDLSKFVLTHMPTASKQRWSSRQELTGADGGALVLSSEIAEMLRELGIDDSEVVREFEELVREYARQKHPSSNPSPLRGEGNA